jgi:hypothetical protein
MPQKQPQLCGLLLLWGLLRRRLRLLLLGLPQIVLALLHP